MKILVRIALPLLLASLAGVLAGCFPPWWYYEQERTYKDMERRRNVRYPPFDEAEYKPFLETGTASIEGLAGYRKRNLLTANPRGVKVTLDPATTYSRVWWTEHAFYFLEPPTPLDPRFFEYRRTTKVDARGRFRFDNLPPGTYYIQTVTPCCAEDCRPAVAGPFGLSVQVCNRFEDGGADTGLEVTVREGQSVLALVCDNYRHQTTRCGWSR